MSLESVKEPTAVDYWDKVWRDHQRRLPWRKPHPYVKSTLPLLRQAGVQRILDLGAGFGRHALFFAGLGFQQVHALDGSAGGLTALRREAHQRNLRVHTYQGDLDDLPYQSGGMDYVLCWDTIYHGLPQDVARRIQEIRRVLKPNGIFQGTLLSKANSRYGQGMRVAPDTYVLPHDRDKGHPHYYCNEQEVIRQLAGFRLVSLDQVDYPAYSQAYHWLFVTQKIHGRARFNVC
jgi:SAM-dependent methyltransferase